jgi:hypothetical protein
MVDLRWLSEYCIPSQLVSTDELIERGELNVDEPDADFRWFSERDQFCITRYQADVILTERSELNADAPLVDLRWFSECLGSYCKQRLIRATEKRED